MKKKFVTALLLTSILSMSEMKPVLAANNLPVPDAIENNITEKTPRAEITGYAYRIHNGVYQKRLWSYTYANWIDKYWHNA